MNNKNNETEYELLGRANLPKKKNINFFTGILIVIGSSMGAGIFFKSKAVLESNSYSLVFAIISWVIASLAIVMMGVSLLEISTKNKGNLSIVGWNHRFNKWMTYQMSKNFSLYINAALTYFFMPLYAIMSFQDGARIFGFYNFNTKADWAIWTTIILIFNTYFILSSGLSSKWATIQNNVTLIFKFIAIISTIIIGFSIFAFQSKSGNGLDIHWLPKQIDTTNRPSSFLGIAPFGGLFISWAGIFFAYDGFYVSTGIEEELKDKKKTPYVLLMGLSVVTIIHLIIAIAMSINGKGDFKEYAQFLSQRKLGWIYGLTNFSISIGVIGIINGFSLWIPKFIEELIRMKDIPFYKKLANKTNESLPKVGVKYALILIQPTTLLFCIIGSTLYFPYDDPSGYHDLYGSGMSNLYNFADLMSNWISLLAFGFIALAFYGAIFESKKNPKHFPKWFKYVNWFVTIFLLAVVLINFIAPFVDIWLIIYEKNRLTYDVYIQTLRGRILSLIVLTGFILVITLPQFIAKIKGLKRKKTFIENNQC
ncbi:amino acid permease [Mycoplasma crocodyli]|uniref:Putative amino acid permease n=1 Tax=Mycoplasma crocodyli (strain ATCC 51981 / MP145) TaxID=512564 RepID=D5E625_MYCCM|nr:amino acid permease [Mycoplasma crocodyli]ADE19790.1 putative amino acid permease [Mycoplasma crocodyli MP145]